MPFARINSLKRLSYSAQSLISGEGCSTDRIALVVASSAFNINNRSTDRCLARKVLSKIGDLITLLWQHDGALANSNIPPSSENLVLLLKTDT